MPDVDGYALGVLPGTNMIEYGFPLRTEQFAYLTLPRDLSLTEVRRIQRFLEHLIDVTKTARPDV
jgi:hypothetical protein